MADDKPATWAKDLLSALDAHMGASVRVTVRFLTGEPLAVMEGALRSAFDTPSEAADTARRTGRFPMGSFYGVGDALFAFPYTDGVSVWADDDGVGFRDISTNVEILVEWRP